MSERNPYFPHLFSPLKVGTKTFKNRIEAAPALFAFLHLVEAPAFNYYGPGPERAFRMLEAKAAGEGAKPPAREQGQKKENAQPKKEASVVRPVKEEGGKPKNRRRYYHGKPKNKQQ